MENAGLFFKAQTEFIAEYLQIYRYFKDKYIKLY